MPSRAPVSHKRLLASSTPWFSPACLCLDIGASVVVLAGYGEFFIRGVVAYDVAAAMKYGKATLQEVSSESFLVPSMHAFVTCSRAVMVCQAAAGVVDRFSDMGDSNFTGTPCLFESSLGVTIQHFDASLLQGGLIAVDARGNVAMPFNSVGMCRGWVSQEGKVRTETCLPRNARVETVPRVRFQVHVAIWDEDDGTGMVARRVPGAAGSAAGSKQAGEAKKS